MAKVGIGLIGWGVVGGGVVDLLARDRAHITARTGVDLDIRAIVSQPPYTKTAPADAVVGSDIALITGDPDVHIAILLVGGTTVAKDLAVACLSAGKHLVTANKALIAAHGDELFAVAKANKVAIAYEAAVAGGVPIIAALRDGLAANRIDSIHAILNGTCNYILTQMDHKGWSYQQALAEAQSLGYAEADPTLDVNGTDTAHKLAILARIAYGASVPIASIRTEGIQGLTVQDLESAKRLRAKIKLLAVARRQESGLELRVAPTLVPLDHPLAAVHMNYNGIYVVGSFSGPQLFTGQGAGALPTASAVVADAIDMAIGRTAHTVSHYAFFHKPIEVRLLPEAEEHTGSYARFVTQDRPGVLAGITQILSTHNVSVLSMFQGEPDADGRAVIEVVTHPVRGGSFLAAVTAIDSRGITAQPTVCYRKL